MALSRSSIALGYPLRLQGVKSDSDERGHLRRIGHEPADPADRPHQFDVAELRLGASVTGGQVPVRPLAFRSEEHTKRPAHMVRADRHRHDADKVAAGE